MVPILVQQLIYLRSLLISLVLILLSGCQTDTATNIFKKGKFNEEIQCIGSSKKGNYAVYMHGFMGKNFSGQELENLKNLKKLSRSLDVVIAIPKSSKSCYQNGVWQRCWGVEMTKGDAIRSLQVVRRSAAKCFPPKSDFGVIGFSNGGYMATKVFSHCLAPTHAPSLKWLVAVGAAKLWGKGKSRARLHSCGSLSIVAGKRDRSNYESRQNKFRNLKSKGAQVSILLFDGGHELPFGPMITVLREKLKL